MLEKSGFDIIYKNRERFEVENKNINWDKISNYAYYFLLIALIIWLICFRTDVWLHRSSFFGDEAFLLKNIQEKTFLDLFKTLDYVKCCPAFFLIINKLIYNLFEFNDRLLCVIPYLFGVFSIILIPFISNKIFPSKTFSFLFLILLAYHPDLTLASQTFKQYSGDIFCTLLLIYLFLTFKDKIKTQIDFLLTGIIFGLFCFFSFTSQFIIFPMYIFFLFNLVKGKKIKSIISLSIPYFTILGLEYLLIGGTYNNGSNIWLLSPPIYTSFNDFFYTICYFISYLGNFKLIFFVFIIGLISLLIQNKFLAYILLTPIILNLFAQILGIYLFPSYSNNRLILYLTPIFLIIFLKAFEYIYVLIKSQKIKHIMNILIVTSSLFFLYDIIDRDFAHEKIKNGDKYHYFVKTNIKEYIEHLKSHNVRNTDKIVVDIMANWSFDMYSNNIYIDNRIYYYGDFSPLNELEKGTNIWFYNTRFKGEPIDHVANIENWINENCEIIIQEKDDMGELFYVKKIK